MNPSKTPLLSIVISSLHGDNYISVALDSIIQQNFANTEIIVVDRRPTDSTKEIVKRYQQQHSLIKLVTGKNFSQFEAINKGLKLARGKFIGICNDNDYYTLGAFREAIEVLEKSVRPSLVIGNCNIYDENHQFLETQKPALLGLEHFLIGFQSHPASFSQFFYHRSIHDIIGFFTEESRLVMDIWFYLECCSSDEIKIKYLDRHWGNLQKYSGKTTGTPTLHSYSFIQKGYQHRYLKKIRVVPSIKALFFSLHKSQFIYKALEPLRRLRWRLVIYRWRKRVLKKIKNEPVQVSAGEEGLVILICGFQPLRYGNIPIIVSSALKCSFVSRIIVSNNRAGHDLKKFFNFTHPKVNVINQSQNRNCPFRLEILREVSGKYFAIIDDDIFLLPSQIKLLFEELKKSPESVHSFFGEKHPNYFCGSNFESRKYWNQKRTVDNVGRTYFFSAPLIERFNRLNAELESTHHDDLVLSSVGLDSPQIHEIGELLDCITFNMSDVSVSHRPDFVPERVQLVKKIIKMGIGHFATQKDQNEAPFR